MESEIQENIKTDNISIKKMRRQQLLDLISDLTNGIQKQHDESKGLTAEIQTQRDSVNKLSDETQKQHDESKGLIAEIQTQLDSVNKLSDETQKQHDGSKGLIAEIQTQLDSVNKLSDETQKQHDGSKGLIAEIQTQYDSVNKLSAEIQKQYDTASQIIKEKDQKLGALIERINGLLPGATSAGLASSYHDAWKKKNTKYYWIGFLLSLVVLVCGYFYYLLKHTQDINLVNITIRTIVGAPLIWIAWYCQKSISQTNRIKEEYHHQAEDNECF